MTIKRQQLDWLGPITGPFQKCLFLLAAFLAIAKEPGWLGEGPPGVEERASLAETLGKPEEQLSRGLCLAGRHTGEKAEQGRGGKRETCRALLED